MVWTSQMDAQVLGKGRSRNEIGLARCILVDIGPFISSGQGFVYCLRRQLLHFMLDFISDAPSTCVAKVDPLSDLRLERKESHPSQTQKVVKVVG